MSKVKIKKIDSAKFYYTDPRNILDDINSIPELYYLANIVMSTNYRSKINPEVPLLIGYEAYSKLINYYGGSSIYVPTRDELQDNLLGVMSYYYYSVKGMSWSDTMKKLGLTQTKGSRRLIRNRWKVFKDMIDSQESKIPELDPVAEPEPKNLKEPPIRCVDTYINKDDYTKIAKSIIDEMLDKGYIDRDKAIEMIKDYE